MDSGITTGACAAAAAKAAAQHLCGAAVSQVSLTLLDGTAVRLPVAAARTGPSCARGTVIKPACGDADVTAGAAVTAEVRPADDGDIHFSAGPGVGIVTLPGLGIPPGEPAITAGPRRLIAAALHEVRAGGWWVRLSIAGGESLARQTRNPAVGVRGGLSILGTTGRQRAYDPRSWRCAIACHVAVAAHQPAAVVVLTPGRIGACSARQALGVPDTAVVEVGNDWEGALQAVRRFAWRRLVAWGHPGKLLKLVAGCGDTHSARSPCAVDIAAGLSCCPVGRAHRTIEAAMQALAPAARAATAACWAARIAAALKEAAPCGPWSVGLITRDGAVAATHGDRP